MKNLGLQLFTIRDFMKSEEDIDRSFARLAELGYTEGQTAGLPAVCDEVFASLAKKHGIDIVGTHYVWDKIVNEPDAVRKTHEIWGTKNIGIGGMPPEARGNYDSLMKFIEQFNASAALYAKDGYKLTYHNHSFEFVRVNGNKTIMDYLYEELDPVNTSFVLDTCWVAHGGADVRYWMEKLAGRIDILHLKDIKVFHNEEGKIEGTMTEIGNGNIYWDGVMETAEKIGVRSYVVEQDKNFIDNDPFKSLKVSADYLAKYICR